MGASEDRRFGIVPFWNFEREREWAQEAVSGA